MHRIVGKPFGHRPFEHPSPDVHRLIDEDAGIHQRRFAVHDGREIHLVENVLLQIDTRRDLGQFQPSGSQSEDAALGDVKHALAPLGRLWAAEGAVLDFLDELLRLAVFQNQQFSGVDRNFQIAGGKRTDKNYFLGLLRNIDEAARPGQPRAEFGDIQVALLVGLGQPEESNVEAAAIVEIKLAGLVDNRLGVGRRAETQATGRYATDHAGLGGQRHQIDHLLLGGDIGDAFRHADAEIDHGVDLQLQRCPTGDDLAFAHRHRGNRRHRYLDFPGKGRAVLFAEGLHVVFGLFSHHDAIDQNAGNFYLPRVQRATLGDAFDLHDDDAAGVARRHRDGLRFQRQRLLLHGDIAVRIGRRAANDADIDREGLVEQVFLAVDFHDPNEVVCRHLVQLAAPKTRIDKRPQTNAGNRARLAGGDVAEKVSNHPLRQVVGFNPVGHGQLLQLGHQAPMAANHPTNQTIMT